MSSSHDGRPCKPGLRVGHINVKHAHNKISEISSIIILETSGKIFLIFSMSDCRLKNEICNTELNIPGYSVIKRDPSNHKEAGFAIYTLSSDNFKHDSYLELTMLNQCGLKFA